MRIRSIAFSWQVASYGAFDFGPGARRVRLGIDISKRRIYELSLLIQNIQQAELPQPVRLADNVQICDGRIDYATVQKIERVFRCTPSLVRCLHLKRDAPFQILTPKSRPRGTCRCRLNIAS